MTAEYFFRGSIVLKKETHCQIFTFENSDSGISNLTKKSAVFLLCTISNVGEFIQIDSQILIYLFVIFPEKGALISLENPED